MFAHKLSTPRRRLAGLLAAIAPLGALAIPAISHAYVGQSKQLPVFHGTGTVKLTGWAPSGTATWRYSDGPRCIYIQYKHTAVLGVDGRWHRLTANSCGATQSTTWSKPASGYNGIKFRLCQDVPSAGDPCGGAVNIGITAQRDGDRDEAVDYSEAGISDL